MKNRSNPVTHIWQQVDYSDLVSCFSVISVTPKKAPAEMAYGIDIDVVTNPTTFRLSIPETYAKHVNLIQTSNSIVSLSVTVTPPIESSINIQETSILKSIIDNLYQYPYPSSPYILPSSETLATCNSSHTIPVLNSYNTKLYNLVLLSKNSHKYNHLSLPTWNLNEIKRIFDLGIKLGISFSSTPNHTMRFLVSKTSTSEPILKPIPILPKKTITKKLCCPKPYLC